MISVIIPTFNEEERIAQTLNVLKQQSVDHEVIVVDGFSKDRTVEIASRQTTVINGVAGRAVQMNKGASIANGDILLFLHADTNLPPNALTTIENNKSKFRWGAFYQQYDRKHPMLNLISWRSNRIRLNKFHVAMGDQAIFVKEEVFNKLNGFPKLELMEDVELTRKLRQQSPPFIIKTPVTTSARRYKNGIVKTYSKMFLIQILHNIGVPSRTLKKLYK